MTHDSPSLDRYLTAFERLRRDPSQPWPESSLGRAPYKPLLLLAVIDRIAEGSLLENFISLDPELGDLFNGYWSLLMPKHWTSNIAMPFYYLQSEGFWHLVPSSGSKSQVLHISKPSVPALRRKVAGARLDEDLFLLLTLEQSRDLLRMTLIRSHFSLAVQEALALQGVVNAQAFRYSQALLEHARRGERISEPVELLVPVRDQGFRRAVVGAYNHRCAFCGISIRTPDHYTAVDAAHIIDWSVSHNDDPRNGLALCKLCHWTFDAGLMSVSEEYTVILSRELSANYNAPGHLSTLERRGIVGPRHRYLWPDRDALAWHREHKLI